MGKKSVFLYGRTQQQLLSLTNLIAWGEHYAVGHSGIDAQHKKIFDLGFSVYENWRDSGDIDLLHPRMEKLAGLLEAHFRYEESILDEIGYGDLNEHAAEHQSMLKEMEVMQDTVKERLVQLEKGGGFRGGSILAPDWPVMQFFMGFAIWHVTYSDMRYFEVLAASHSFR
jgi:hemerythrin-like metal-binding protein